MIIKKDNDKIGIIWRLWKGSKFVYYFRTIARAPSYSTTLQALNFAFARNTKKLKELFSYPNIILEVRKDGTIFGISEKKTVEKKTPYSTDEMVEILAQMLETNDPIVKNLFMCVDDGKFLKFNRKSIETHNRING